MKQFLYLTINKIVLAFLLGVQALQSSHYVLDQTISLKTSSARKTFVDSIAVNKLGNKIITTNTEEEVSDGGHWRQITTYSCIAVWNILTNSIEAKIYVPRPHMLKQALFHTHDNYISAIHNGHAESPGTITTWDIRSIKEIVQQERQINHTLNCLALNQNSSIIALGGSSGHLSLIDSFTLKGPTLEEDLTQTFKENSVTAVNFNADSSRLVSAHFLKRFSGPYLHNKNSCIKIWNVANKNCEMVLDESVSALWRLRSFRNPTIQSINFFSLNDNLITAVTCDAFFIIDAEQSIQTDINGYPYNVAIEPTGKIISTSNINKELFYMNSNGSYDLKLSDYSENEVVIASLQTFCFNGQGGHQSLIVPQSGKHDNKPICQIFTTKPSFLDIQKRQFTGAFSKLKKSKT